tara:strand:+ start:542 stop:2119 length:1578 start_codon:yes stop_codon:yes gene_type:complete
MVNINEYMWNFVERKTEGSQYKDPTYIDNKSPLDIANMNKKFEGFFYTIAGMSREDDLFPLGRNLTVDKFDKMMKASLYYNTENKCFSPLVMWEPKHANILKELEDPVAIAIEGFKKHGYDVPDSVDSYDKLVAYNKEEYMKIIKEIIDYYKEILAYKLEPEVIDTEGKITFKLKNPNPKFLASNMLVEYNPQSTPYYPELFKGINKVNTKLVKNNFDIDKLLGIITMSHMPLFSNTHFKQNLFSIRLSPGLMTSPTPKLNKKMRMLPWVVSEKKHDVIFWDGKEGVPNYFLESYAGPLNHNAEIFCSLFPNDMYTNGCIGKFDETIVDRLKSHNWIPRIVMANPPYANEQVIQSNVLTDLLHKNFKTISIITISRRDNALFDPLMKEVNRRVGGRTHLNLMKKLIESPYLHNIYVIPEATFVYACLFTQKEFSVSSRKGERPTDTIMIFKSTDPDKSHIEEVERIFIDGLPKDKSYRINEEDQDRVISELEERRDLQKIDPKIMDKAFIKRLIKNTNLMVSGES